MNAEQMLERYIMEHPDYWEFEDEMNEVAELMSLCDKRADNQNVIAINNYVRLQLCV